MKKALSIVLSICMLFSIVFGLNYSAIALDSSGSCGENVTYTFDESTGLLTISGSGAMTSYTSASGSPFYQQTGIKTVVINEGVTTVGSYAFVYCSGITSVSIANSVTSIGNVSFSNCSSLTEIEIPDSVTYIGSSAFYNCSNLTSIIISENITYIGNLVFSNTGYYKDSANWENKLLYIGKYLLTAKTDIAGACEVKDATALIAHSAFESCNQMTSVSIPDSVTSIGLSAFKNCSALKELTMPCSAKIGNSEYTFYNCTNIEKVTLTKGTGTMQNYSMVTSDSDTSYKYTPWYISRNSIKDVVFEDGISNIGTCAFCNCSGLKNVEISSSITSIDYRAFFGCSSLLSIEITNSVTSIGDDAFRGCSGITSAEIPDSVTNLGKYVFYGCTGLTSVTLGNGLTSISNAMFLGCSSLSEIEIPNSVTSIATSAFSNCSALTSVTIGKNVASIGENAFSNCSAIKELTMPCSAKIGNSEDTFYNCTNIEKVTLTKGTGTMQNYGTSTSSTATSTYYQYTPWYLSRSKCKEIIIENGINNIGDYMFFGCSSITSVEIPNSVKSIGNNAFSWCSGLTSVTIPNGVTKIGSYAFRECNKLTSITIPDSVTEIGAMAFYNCVGLKELTIPCSVKTASANHSFYNCTNIEKVIITKGTGIMQDYFTGSNSYYAPWYYSEKCKEIVLEDGITHIGNYAFERCVALTSIEIPDSVTSIGHYAFRYCPNLTSLEIPENVTSIGSSAFYGCRGLTSLTIPESVTRICDCAFSGCSGLKSMVVDSNNTIYDSRENCNAIIETSSNTLLFGCENTIIPYSVTSIGKEAFYGCGGLSSITIPESVTNIGVSAFSYCEGLTNVTLEKGITNIGNNTFFECISLKNITIPSTVTSIGNYAFYQCTGMEDVYYTGTEEDWNSISVGTYNSDLTGANIHYNFRPQCNVHSPGEIVVENEIPATYEAEGSYDEVVYCTVCQTELSRETKTVEKLHYHEFGYMTIENVFSNSCTADGSYDKEYHCGICGEVYEIETVFVERTEHVPMIRNEYITAVSCTENGTYDIVTYCAVCGEEINRETNEIPATGHNYICYGTNDEGLLEYECALCKENHTENPKVLFENWQNNLINKEVKSTRYDDSSYFDVVADGVINAKDYACLLKVSKKAPDISGNSDLYIQLTYPCPSYTKITCGFGDYAGHYGCDFSTNGNEDQEVVAAESGTVIISADLGDRSYGRYIVIKHDKKTSDGKDVYTLYAHNNSGEVSAGEHVEKGQLIAYSGSTGNSTGPHLHFEVRVGGASQSNAVDPELYLPKQ